MLSMVSSIMHKMYLSKKDLDLWLFLEIVKVIAFFTDISVARYEELKFGGVTNKSNHLYMGNYRIKITS